MTPPPIISALAPHDFFMIVFSVFVLFGSALPDGILWGHTLNQYIGEAGVTIGAILMLAGALRVFFGWRGAKRPIWNASSAMITANTGRKPACSSPGCGLRRQQRRESAWRS